MPMKAAVLWLFILTVFDVSTPLFAASYPGDRAVVREIEQMEKARLLSGDANFPSSTDSGSISPVIRYVFQVVLIGGLLTVILLMIRKIRSSTVAGESYPEGDPVPPDPDGGTVDPEEILKSAENARGNGRYSDCVRILYRGLAACILQHISGEGDVFCTDGQLLRSLNSNAVLISGCRDFFVTAQAVIFGGFPADNLNCKRMIRLFRKICSGFEGELR